MFDFKGMRKLIRQCGEAWENYNNALHEAEPKSPILSDMPKAQGVGNPVERAVIRADDLYSAYKQSFRQLENMRRELTPLIDKLMDPTDKAVMRLRYIEGFSPDVIADSGLFPMGRTGIYNHLYHAQECIRCWQVGQKG